MAFSRQKKYINDGHCSSQKVFGRPTSSFEVLFLMTRQVFIMTFSCRKKYTNDSLSSSQTLFGRPTSSYEIEFAMAIIKYL